MSRFIFKRIFTGILVIWGIITLIFFIFSGLGDPAEAIKAQQASKLTEQAIAEKYHLDEPLMKQYLLYLRDLSPISVADYDGTTAASYDAVKIFKTGDKAWLVLKWPYMQRSFQSDRKVSEMLAENIPGTAILALTAIVIACITGVFAGVFASLKKGSWIDQAIVFISLLGISAPSFFMAVLLIWIFAILLGDYTNLNITGYIYEEKVFGEGYYLRLQNLILPAIALGIRPLSIITQLTRSSMLEVNNMDYIRTARAKGMKEKAIIFKHSLRNALNPVITSVSSWFASLLAGAFFVEYIFNWQGIGKLTIDALYKNDYPVILGCVIFIGCVFVVVSVLVDILYAKLDPRVKLTA